MRRSGVASSNTRTGRHAYAAGAHALVEASGRRENEACDFLGFIHLYKVPRCRQQEEIGRWEQCVKRFGHTLVQIRIAAAEDDAHRSAKLSQLGDVPRAGAYGAQQVLIESEEGRPGARRRVEVTH